MENNEIKKPEVATETVEQPAEISNDALDFEIKESPKSEDGMVNAGSDEETPVKTEKYPQAPVVFKPFKTVEGEKLKDGLEKAVSEKTLPNNFILPSFTYQEQIDIGSKYFNNSEDGNLELAAAIANSDIVVPKRAKGRMRTIQAEGKEDRYVDIFGDRLSSGNFTNSLLVDKKEMNLRTLTAENIVNAKSNGKANKEELAFFRFLSTAGNGEQINIPLWHSGFRIVLKPMDVMTYVSLMNTIQQDKATYGKSLIGFIYSYDSFIVNRHVLNMVSNLIVYTTLDINRKEEDIFNFISILDLNMIYLGLLASLFSSGIEFSMQCKNATVTTDDGNIKCNNQLVGLLDPTRISWVDTDRLTGDNKWMFKQMQKMSAGSVSQAEAQAYRNRVESYTKEDGYTIVSSNPRLKGKHSSTFKFKIPTLMEYLDTGETWKMVIEEEVRKALGNNDGAQPNEDEAVQNIYSILTVARYLAYIDRIENSVEGNDEESGSDTIYDTEFLTKALVSILSIPSKENKKKYQEIEEAITRNIEDASLAIMAIPTFTCSKCGATREVQQVFKSDRLKDLIPLDGLYTFFDVADLLSQNMG